MKTEIIAGKPWPEALKREWEALLSASRFQNPFLTPAWNEIWLKHFGNSLQTMIILFRAVGGDLLALGAFSSLNGKEGKKGLALWGSADVCDYRDLIISSGQEEETCRELARFFGMGSWDFLELNGISEFSPTIQVLPPLMRSFGFRVVQEVEEISVYLKLPSTWERFLEELSAKDRHELRRKIRRLEREAKFEFSGMEGNPFVPERMEAFFTLHRKSGKDKAEFMTPAMVEFFRELSIRYQEKGWLNLSFLKVEEKDAAAFLSFDFQGTEYVYNSGYDPQFGRFSPGIILSSQCIRRAIEKGMTHFNFLRGREDYKYNLGGKEEKICRIRVEKP